MQRKELKRKGRAVLKKHYWHAVIICFIMAYVAGFYSENSTLILFTAYNETNEVAEPVEIKSVTAGDGDLAIAREVLASIGIKVPDQNGARKDTKYTRGVFSYIVNNMSGSNSLVFGILNVINQGLFKGQIVYSLILLLGVAIMGAMWFFISNVLVVGQCRYFMEASGYQKTSGKRALFLISIHRWVHACVVMFFTSLYLVLWMLTIVGGVIKSYSYMMVSYIVAENPNVTRKEAIKLSRDMMRGYKWKAFVLDLSFIGWSLLGVVTLGLSSIFYTNPYQTATKTQFYFAVRGQAIHNKIQNYQLFNDRYLTEQPAMQGEQTMPLTQYPVELFSIPEGKRKNWIHVEYDRKYTIWSLILLFIIFSVVGWLWEVSLHLSKEGFVNRGVLHGPWLPIYGSGGVLVLVLLKKVRKNPLWTFALTVVTCGVLEYYTSWYLETFKGHKWWDYSGYFLNLNGRICAEGLLVFGLGGCSFIYLFAPLLDELIKKIPIKIQITLCVVLMGVFLADEAYSGKHPNTGKGVTDYAFRETDPILGNISQYRAPRLGAWDKSPGN